jgi:hypothetical protein
MRAGRLDDDVTFVRPLARCTDEVLAEDVTNERVNRAMIAATAAPSVIDGSM